MRRKWLAIGIILLLVGIAYAPAMAQTTEKQISVSRGTLLYVGGSGPGNYSRIQDAIDDASDGDTIFVYNGTYYEHITVNKQLTLIGIPSSSEDIPFIDSGDEITVLITADKCILDTFQIGSDWDFGILLQSDETIVRNCSVLKADGDIKLDHASHNVISDNIFRGNFQGILLQGSSNNTIRNNIVDQQWRSMTLWENSCYNLVYGNNFSNSRYWAGIDNGDNCSYNIFKNNTLCNNAEVGIYIMHAYGISIIGNSFINNGIAFSSSVPELLSYTIEENTINDKNIYFYKNDNDVLVPSDAGQVFLVQCTDFTLQDLTISHVRTGYDRMGGGICLINSSHITIQGCHISSCSPVGMYMVNSDHNTISSNNLSKNFYYGVYCIHSAGNIFSDNIIREGRDKGIFLRDSSGNTIKKNTISQFSVCVHLDASSCNILYKNIIMSKMTISSMSTFNRIIQNHIQGGVDIRVGCRSNTFRYNTISNGVYGIYLESLCNSNNFIKNNIVNTDVGVLSETCQLNMFKRNNFINNSVHAYFEYVFLFNVLPNFWRGNYWDDWDGSPPKSIEGKMIIHHISMDPDNPIPDTVKPWTNFDWHPAQEPYDIPGT